MRTALSLTLLLCLACDDPKSSPEPPTSGASAEPMRTAAPVASSSAASVPIVADKPKPGAGPDASPGPAVAARNMPLPPAAAEDRGRSTTVTDALAGYGFPTHQSLRHLCGRRLLEPGGGQVHWDAFGSSETPATLTKAYEKRLGKRGQTASKAGTRWTLPPGSPTPRRSLEVLPFRSSGRHQSCGPLDGGAPSSVLVVTRR